MILHVAAAHYQTPRPDWPGTMPVYKGGSVGIYKPDLQQIVPSFPEKARREIAVLEKSDSSSDYLRFGAWYGDGRRFELELELIHTHMARFVSQ